MKTGRPSSWNPLAAIERAVWTDVVPLGSKSRVIFPANVRNEVTWLANSGDGVLAVVEPEKFVELLPWEPNGVTAMASVKRLLQDAEESERGELALAAMDRYVRLTMDGTGRAVLPGSLVAHLDAAETEIVRMVMRDGRLWLWSEKYWQAQRGQRIALLAEKETSRAGS
jgi:DNA-binding transcriptional regulator/RsmH inhibitor MraZ